MSEVATPRAWFLTLTGQQFFYDDPEPYPYTIAEIAHALHVAPMPSDEARDFFDVAWMSYGG